MISITGFSPCCAPTLAAQWLRSPTELAVSRATIRARIDRLLQSGVIGGFTITVRDPPNAITSARSCSSRSRAAASTR